MSFVAVAVGATVSVGMGLYAANQAKQQQKGALGQQQRQYDEQLAFQKEQYAEEKARRDKSEAPLWAELNANPNVAFGKYKGNIDMNFDNAGRQIERHVAGAKMAGSALDHALVQGNELERAKALSTAFKQVGADRLQIAGALAGRTNVGGAASGVAGTMGRMGDFWGNRATTLGNEATAGYTAAGQGIGNLFSIGKQAGWWGGATTPPPATTAPPAGAPIWSNQSIGGSSFGPQFTPPPR